MSIKIETALQKFIELRDKRAEIRRKYEEEDAVYNAAQEKIESFLLKTCEKQQIDSIRAGSVTAFIQKVSRARCEDWTSFWDWMAKVRRFDLQERRVSNKGISEYVEETGSLPPGITVNTERVIRVRRV